MKTSSSYSNRDEYRNKVVSDLCCWRTEYKETELLICAENAYQNEALQATVKLRKMLDKYIAQNEQFEKSYSPVEARPDAPKVIVDMCSAAKVANVGPMAAVAGAFAAYVGQELLKHSGQVIVENGGDVFMKTKKNRTVAIYAGKSPISMKLGIEIDSREIPVAICTSSGTVGHSKSFGNVDAAVVVSHDACLADACATRLGNEIGCESDIQKALDTIYCIEGVIGAVAVKGEQCGAVGDIQLERL